MAALGLPFPGMSFFQRGPLLPALTATLDQTVKGVLLLLERLCMPRDGLSGAVQLLYGVPDLLLIENPGCREIGRRGQLLGQPRLLERGISNGP